MTDIKRIFSEFAITVAMVVGVSATSASADTRYVGAFLPAQGPTLDQIIGGRYADDYFMDIWRAYEAGRVSGASSNVAVFLHHANSGRNEVLYQGRIQGHRYIPVNRSQIRRDTLVCVTTDRTIRHQRVSAGPNTMCTTRGSANRYMSEGQGRQPGDAYGVIAPLSP